MGAGSDVCASLLCARGRQIRKAGRQADAQPEALQPTSGTSANPPHPTPGKFVLRRPVPTRGEASPRGSARLRPRPVPAPPPASFPPDLRILSPFPFFLTKRLAMECRGLLIPAMAVHSEFRVEPRANRGAPGLRAHRARGSPARLGGEQSPGPGGDRAGAAWAYLPQPSRCRIPSVCPSRFPDVP